MKIAVMQPYFVPYIGYFQLINAVDKFVILDDVNFIKRGWINRNRILLSNNIYSFSIPLQKITQNRKINETKIVDDNKWRSKLLQTIKHSYSKAKYFNDVYPIIKDSIEYNSKNISEFNVKCLKNICNYLDIQTEIIESSTGYETEALKGKEKLIKICKSENANTYINSVGGMTLYQKDDFKKHGINLLFLKPNLISYEQLSETFLPGLSIIDFIMNNGKMNIFNNYDLI